jgi:hypothetical protein
MTIAKHILLTSRAVFGRPHVKNGASVRHLLFPYDTAQLWLYIALAHMSKIPYTCSSCSIRPKLAIRAPILGHGSPAYRVVAS